MSVGLIDNKGYAEKNCEKLCTGCAEPWETMTKNNCAWISVRKYGIFLFFP